LEKKSASIFGENEQSVSFRGKRRSDKWEAIFQRHRRHANNEKGEREKEREREIKWKKGRKGKWEDVLRSAAKTIRDM
jgi:hypothetical protein